MSLKRDISYDNSHDQIVGPHGKANVAILKSIFAPNDKKYLIPHWYGFDTRMESKVLLDNIMKIQSEGYQVVIITCDNAPDNRKLANELGITDDNPYFMNPDPQYEGEKIYFGPDPVHLTKSMRGHFIDQGKFGIFQLFLTTLSE